MNDSRSYEAERALLGILLMHPALIDEALGHVAGPDFHFQYYRAAFDRVCELHARDLPIDAVTACREGDDPTELITAVGDTRSLDGVEKRAAVIAEYARVRRVEYALTSAAERIRAIDHLGVEAVITDALAEIGRAAAKRDEKPHTVTHAEAAYEYALEFRKRAEAGRGMAGWRTGFDSLDDAIGGIEQGLVYVVAARPAMGKTALALQIAESIADDSDGIVLFYSLEMKAMHLGGRLLARHANIPYQRLKAGKMEAGDGERFANAIRRMRAANGRWLIDDRPGVNVARIARNVRNFNRAHAAGNGPPVVACVCDYLQRCSGEGRGDTDRISRISRELADLSTAENVAMIEVCQLNRDCEKRTDKRPTMADLKNSGEIEQDADCIMLLYRDDVYSEREGRPSKDPGMASIIIAKQRSGETQTLREPWFGKYQRFGDLPR